MTPDLRWEDGVPVSSEYDDPYYSKADGLAETRYVFLDGCGLPGGWAGRQTYQIAELGFGTGLNFCATWSAWKAIQPSDSAAQLHFTSFEQHPLDAAAIDRALSAWPELEAEREALVSAWSPVGGTFAFGSAHLTVIVGDAREALPAWQGKADAWFLDGFAPARNPAMWEPDLMAAVARATAHGGRFATYTVAGFVRRGLADAGFAVEKRPGFGTKREMITGHLKNCD